MQKLTCDEDSFSSLTLTSALSWESRQKVNINKIKHIYV